MTSNKFSNAKGLLKKPKICKPSPPPSDLLPWEPPPSFPFAYTVEFKTPPTLLEGTAVFSLNLPGNYNAYVEVEDVILSWNLYYPPLAAGSYVNLDYTHPDGYAAHDSPSLDWPLFVGQDYVYLYEQDVEEEVLTKFAVSISPEPP